MDGFLISYLKLPCSITGYQPNGAEIQIRNRIVGSGWAKKDMKNGLKMQDELGHFVNPYYPCYGAMLEVVVAPPRPKVI
ncbi:hypothetical protein OIE68_46085 [Nocardia vinacea]|uniref:hypothetical protein n=1 Tax=Nocardia vinacea TaxID=96468 RepID=UPI002E1199A9|nr:hypothetical protein OIE68_46085 [Nocardia vinacea]